MSEHEPSTAKIERYVAPTMLAEDIPVERANESRLRPSRFSDFPGQDRAKENLTIYVEAAKKRAGTLDHVLLHGPPGLGKTSLARIIANEMGVEFYQTSGPALDKPGDLAGILAGLSKGSVLFIDEIHRLSVVVEEVLYSAMEDFYIDIVVGQGPTARTVKMPINPFTLVGATTRVALLTSPLVSRFGIKERFEYYEHSSLIKIILRASTIEGVKISSSGINELALRSRGTPRIANRLLRRVRDFADFHDENEISGDRVDAALNAMEIDKRGLEPMDRKMLLAIRDKYDGGPVGIETLAYTVGEERATLEEVYEPYLVYQGLLARGPRGREITELGLKHLTETGNSINI
jgi:Holliday junction DNA helicase RuvB